MTSASSETKTVDVTTLASDDPIAGLNLLTYPKGSPNVSDAPIMIQRGCIGQFYPCMHFIKLRDGTFVRYQLDELHDLAKQWGFIFEHICRLPSKP